MDDAEAAPLGGGIAGFFQQLPLRGFEVRLARVELAGRELDELAPVRIAELPLDEAIAMIRDGRITDSKTVVGLLWVKSFLP